MRSRLAVLACLLGTVVNSAWGQIYRCEHAGRVNFSDRPCALDSSASQKRVRSAPLVDIAFRSETVHYAVQGEDGAQAWADVKRKGPMGFAGFARWHVAYRYESERSGQLCRMSSLNIQVKGTIQMPEWSGVAQASPADQAWWRTMYANLMRHEEGHVQHGREFGILLREKLIGIGGVPCDELSARAQAVYEQLMNNLKDRDKEYDRRTAHGVRQDNPVY